eukprot:1158635-Pelagomonas_calceolata.AAC.4
MHQPCCIFSILAQNVSDVLSCQAFLSLASAFPSARYRQGMARLAAVTGETSLLLDAHPNCYSCSRSSSSNNKQGQNEQGCSAEAGSGTSGAFAASCGWVEGCAGGCGGGWKCDGASAGDGGGASMHASGDALEVGQDMVIWLSGLMLASTLDPPKCEFTKMIG